MSAVEIAFSNFFEVFSQTFVEINQLKSTYYHLIQNTQGIEPKIVANFLEPLSVKKLKQITNNLQLIFSDIKVILSATKYNLKSQIFCNILTNSDFVFEETQQTEEESEEEIPEINFDRLDEIKDLIHEFKEESNNYLTCISKIKSINKSFKKLGKVSKEEASEILEEFKDSVVLTASTKNLPVSDINEMFISKGFYVYDLSSKKLSNELKNELKKVFKMITNKL